MGSQPRDGHPNRRSRGDRAGLTPDHIVSVALDLLDDEGLASFSMRALAIRLGVSPMAVYNHFSNRQELLAAVLDHVMEAAKPSSRAHSWRRRLVELASTMRQVQLAHPGAAELARSADFVTPAALSLIEFALEALTDAGLDAGEARSAWISLNSLVNGHVGYETAQHFSDSEAVLDAGAFAEEFPHLQAALSLGPVDYETDFEVALARFLNALVAKPR